MLAFMAMFGAASAAAVTPSPQPQLPADIAWASATADDDRFWIRTADVRSQYYPASVTVWLHGEHGYNHHVAYKTSLQQIRFFCNGTLQLVALATTDGDGRTSKWRGGGTIDRISSGTVYQKIEREFCAR
jgi:hypothetical protein